MRIELPFPPAELNPNKRIHRLALIGIKQRYKMQCGLLANLAMKKSVWVPPTTTGTVPLTITYVMPDKRKRDRDNLLAASKQALDAVAEALGIDDNQFEPITLRREFGKKPGDMIVEILWIVEKI